jgi:DNA-directed RNA polymerase specialized sigma24 family protein
LAFDVATLRELFRNLQAFRAAAQDFELHEVRSPDGETFLLSDVEYLYECSQRDGVLPPRQAEAIRLCLFENMLERRAAEVMGVALTNPVAMYASSGLEKLIALVESGALPRYRHEAQEDVA